MISISSVMTSTVTSSTASWRKKNSGSGIANGKSPRRRTRIPRKRVRLPIPKVKRRKINKTEKTLARNPEQMYDIYKHMFGVFFYEADAANVFDRKITDSFGRSEVRCSMYLQRIGQTGNTGRDSRRTSGWPWEYQSFGNLSFLQCGWAMHLPSEDSVYQRMHL